MPLCGFNRKMIDGIALFSEGLLEATVERGERNNLDAINSVRLEISEIDLFLAALRKKYGSNVLHARLMGEMIYGIAIFSGGLLKSAEKIAKEQSADLKEIYGEQVIKISKFLGDLEDNHQELKKVHTPEETMVGAVQWIDENDI